MNIKANDLRPGDKIDYDNDIWVVKEVQHRTPGNLRAFVQAKIVSVISGRSKEERFRSTDTVKAADMESKKMQYLYTENDMLTFMEADTYEQVSIAAEDLGDAPKFLIENMEVFIQYLKGKPLGVDLPPSVVLTVVDTEPGVRGDTVNNVLKPAKMETGLTVGVPIFINPGDKIKVDTRTSEYNGRVND